MIKYKKCRYGGGAGRRDRPGSQQNGGSAMKFIKSRRKVEPKAGWISVEDALPKESGQYLVVTKWGSVTEMCFSARHQRFNCRDYYDFGEVDDVSILTNRYWMPMPEPPEELR